MNKTIVIGIIAIMIAMISAANAATSDAESNAIAIGGIATSTSSAYAVDNSTKLDVEIISPTEIY